MKSIRLYTGRELSKSRDVLAAFGGVSLVLEQHFNAQLLWGLPTSHFDLALLWMPLGILDRRRIRNPKQSQYAKDYHPSQESSNDKDDNEFGVEDFPSWSWCGWTNGKIEYTAVMIDGCSQNAHEWLKHHTWIQWHVRDCKGHLRPLWNRKKRYEDSSSDVCWRGYTGLPKLSSLHRDFADHNSSNLRNGGSEEHQRKRNPQDEAHNEQESQDSSLHTQNGAFTQDTFYRDGKESRESQRFYRESNGAYIHEFNLRYCGNDFTARSGQFSKERDTWDRAPLAAGTKDTEPVMSFSASRTKTTKPNDELDDYGRAIRYVLEKSCKFTSILPDNPFGVIRDTFRDIGTQADTMPILQFFTLSSQFYVKLRSRTENKEQSSQFIHCDIFDKAGDWCGCIKLASSWITYRQDRPLFLSPSQMLNRSIETSVQSGTTTYTKNEKNRSGICTMYFY